MTINIDQIEILGEVNSKDYKRIINILKTSKGSIPLLRDFGMDIGFIDLPIEQMKAYFMSEFMDQISKYLPGKAIKKITFTVVDSETIVPKVVMIDG